MQINKDPWFVEQRSEALATLLLSRRDDVVVREVDKHDSGVDLTVLLREDNEITPKYFVVQIKGTTDLEGREWMKGVSHLFAFEEKQHYVPSCIFVVDVRANKIVYSWIAEPSTVDDKAVLKLHNIGNYRDLTLEEVDKIVQQVRDWYDVLSKNLSIHQ